LIDKLALISTPLDFFPVLAGMGNDRDLILEGLETMKTYFRDILVFSETGDDRQVFNRDRIEVISKAAGRMSKQELLNSMKVYKCRGQGVGTECKQAAFAGNDDVSLVQDGLKATAARA